MNTYKRHRFPPDIISYAVWLYYRFNLSHRDIEDLLAEPEVVAVGEAGLDYHYDHSPRDVQRDVFAAQIQMAYFNAVLSQRVDQRQQAMQGVDKGAYISEL